MLPSLQVRAVVLSFVLFFAFVAIWQVGVGNEQASNEGIDPEYAALIGATAKGESAMPGPADVGR